MTGPAQLRERPVSPTWLIAALAAILVALGAAAILYHRASRSCLHVSALAAGDKLAILVRNTCNQPILLESISLTQEGYSSLRELGIRLEPGEARVLTLQVRPDAPISLRLRYRASTEETMVFKVGAR